MADIDQIIAGGAGASTRADFSGIGKLADAYWKGKDQAYQQEGRDLFKNGVPTTADGQPDFAAMGKALFQHGDVGQGTVLSNLDIERQKLGFGQRQSANIQSFEGGGAPPSPQPFVSPPSANRTASTPVAAPLNRGGAEPNASQPSGQPPQQGGTTLMQVLAAQNIPNSQLAAASASIARQLGLDNPNAPIDLNDPQVRNVLVPAVQQLKRMGIGQPAQLGQPTVQEIPPVNPQQPAIQPAPQNGQPAPVTNSVTTTAGPATPSRTDQAIAYYSGIMSDPRSPKANVELAKSRLEAAQKNAEFTPLQKEYAQAVLQGFKGTMQDFEADRETGKSAATERAKAEVKEQQEYISQGKMASQRLQTLNTISNIVSTDPNLNLGFGSETTLKVKMALEKAGFDFGDLSGSQLIQKLNGVLASESSKSFSTRPTQFEFRTFLANNPGLALDEKGNVRMLGILSQNAKREADLGKLARQNQDNWSKWDDVVEAYDKANPIKDPTTGKVLSNHSIIAPGTKQASAKSQAQFNSPADVHAAVASGKLKSGDAFTDPTGKTRYVP